MRAYLVARQIRSWHELLPRPHLVNCPQFMQGVSYPCAARLRAPILRRAASDVLTHPLLVVVVRESPPLVLVRRCPFVRHHVDMTLSWCRGTA